MASVSASKERAPCDRTLHLLDRSRTLKRQSYRALFCWNQTNGLLQGLGEHQQQQQEKPPKQNSFSSQQKFENERRTS